MGHAVKPVEECDPRGLIRECYRIEGITGAECRTVFLDWAISLPAGAEAEAMIPSLIAHYAGDAPDHPMTGVLREGLGRTSAPRGRRGGSAARRSV